MARFFCVTILVLLLLAPAGLRADDHAQPVPPDAKCAVPADKDWTTQEKFVWERVCAGQSANFNLGTGYDGDLDPRKSGVLPASRILRSSFIEAILLKDEYRKALTRRGVHIVGARFSETLDLEEAALGHRLWFDRCLFESGANFRGLTSEHLLIFSGSKVRGLLNLNSLRVGSGLFLRGGSEFEDVDLIAAYIGGTLDLNNSEVTGALNLNSSHVGSRLMMQSGSFAAVNLVGATIKGPLDLSRSKVTGTLNLNAVHVDGILLMRNGAEFGEVDLRAARVAGNLDLDNSKVTGTLNLSTAHVDGNLFMRNGAEFGQITLTGAHVGESLELTGSKVTRDLNMNSVHVAFHLLMGKVEIPGANLRRGTVGGNLQLAGSKVTKTLDMKGLRVGAVLFMQGSRFADVNLEGAHVDLDVDFSGSHVADALNMDSVQIGGSLRMRGPSTLGDAIFHDVSLKASRVRVLDLDHSSVSGMLDMAGISVETSLSMRRAKLAGVKLSGARVGGDVNLEDANVSGQLDMNGLRIDGMLSAPGLHVGASVATSARIAGWVDLTGASVSGNLVGTDLETGRDLFLKDGRFCGSIQLHRARVRGDLELANGEFHGLVDLTGAQIGGELGLDSAKWGNDAALSLRDARADIVPSFANAGPPRPSPGILALSGGPACPAPSSSDVQHPKSRLDLDGFTYRNVGESKDFEQWFARLDRYSAQPYNQLASVVQAQGRNELATAIRYAGKNREREELTGWPWIWLTMLWGSIGYGYHLERALILVVFFIAAGTIGLWLSEQSWRNGLRSWPSRIVYSVDMLLPIIKLREEDYKIDLTGPLAYYYYFHKIMGYVLASFLIAGLSGLTK